MNIRIVEAPWKVVADKGNGNDTLDEWNNEHVVNYGSTCLSIPRRPQPGRLRINIKPGVVRM
jgi:hypothetical protein